MANRRVTEATHAADGTKTFSQLDREMAEITDAWATVTECMLCDWTFSGTAAAGREASAFHRAREHPAKANGATARELLEKMDRGESVAAESGPADPPRLEPASAADLRPEAVAESDASGGASEPHGNRHGAHWTKERIVEAIQTWAREHDNTSPLGADFRTENGLPNKSTVNRAFGNVGNAIVAAGFERPTQGRRRKSPSVTQGVSSKSLPDPPPQAEDEKPEVVDPPPASQRGDALALTIPTLPSLDVLQNEERVVPALEEAARKYDVAASALRQIISGVRTLEELARD